MANAEPVPIERFVQLCADGLPAALPAWWKRVRNVEANRLAYGDGWLAVKSCWADYDRARGTFAPADEREAALGFLRRFRPDPSAVADAVRRARAGAAPSRDPVAGMFGPGETPLVDGMLAVYADELRRWLTARGVPAAAAEIGAAAYAGPLLGHVDVAARAYTAECARVAGPRVVSRGLVAGGVRQVEVVTWLRIYFGIGLAEAVGVYKGVAAESGQESRPPDVPSGRC